MHRLIRNGYLGLAGAAVLVLTGCATMRINTDGVMTGQLRRDPPDLTRLRGVSAERLRRTIDGRDVAAHGNRTMPVWGEVFLRRENDRSGANARVAALVS